MHVPETVGAGEGNKERKKFRVGSARGPYGAAPQFGVRR
jgi:hypothetical protein